MRNEHSWWLSNLLIERIEKTHNYVQMYLRFCSSLVTTLYIFFKGVDGRYYFVVYLYYIHVHFYVSHFCDNMLSLLTLYKCMTGEKSRFHHINDVIISKFSTISISERKMALNVCKCSCRNIYLVREQVEADGNKRNRAITNCWSALYLAGCV